MSTSTVSGTNIQDPSGQVLANGTWQLYFTPTYGRPGPFLDGGVSFTHIYTGSLDATGSFSQAGVNRNDTISPAGSLWLFIVTPAVNGQSFQVLINVNSPAFDLTTAINSAISLITVTSSPLARAYKDSELINVDGASALYYDETLKVLKVWDAVTASFLPITPNGGSPTFGNLTVTTSLVNNGTELLTNAGLFTNVTNPAYIRSNIGGLNFDSEITAWANGPTLDALDGGVLIPAGSTRAQVNGIAGYINNSSPTTAGVAIWGGGRALANGARVWGADFQAQDIVGLTAGVVLNGVEIDVTPTNVSTAYGAVTGLPVVMGSGAHAGTFGDAIVTSSNNAVAKWGNGIRTADGAVVTGVLIGKALAAGASASQNLQLKANDGASDFTPSILLSSAIDWTIPIAKSGRNILIQNNAASANLVQINDTGLMNFSNPTNSTLKLDWSATDVGNIAGGGTAPGLRIASAQSTGQNGVIIFANNRVDGTESGRITTSTKAWTLNGLVTTYNAIATADFGLTPVQGTPVHLTGQAANLAATNLFASVAAGTYKVYFNARTTTSGTGTTATVSVSWTDEGGAKTFTSATWALNSVTITGAVFGVLVIHAQAASAIQVSTTGTFGTSVYAIDSWVEREN